MPQPAAAPRPIAPRTHRSRAADCYRCRRQGRWGPRPAVERRAPRAEAEAGAGPWRSSPGAASPAAPRPGSPRRAGAAGWQSGGWPRPRAARRGPAADYNSQRSAARPSGGGGGSGRGNESGCPVSRLHLQAAA